MRLPIFDMLVTGSLISSVFANTPSYCVQKQLKRLLTLNHFFWSGYRAISRSVDLTLKQVS